MELHLAQFCNLRRPMSLLHQEFGHVHTAATFHDEGKANDAEVGYVQLVAVREKKERLVPWAESEALVKPHGPMWTGFVNRDLLI